MMEEQQRNRTDIYARCLALVTLVAVAFILINKSYFKRVREFHHPPMCQTNLNGVGKSLALYSATNMDVIPFDYAPLVNGGFASKKMFICPGHMRNANLPENYDNTDYIMIVSGMHIKGSDAQVIELPINHNQQKVFYLTCGGSILDFNEKNMRQFTAIVQDTNDVLKKLRSGR